MYGVRKNILVVDFSVLPIRPEIGKVQAFLETEINLQYSDVTSIQLHHLRNCVLIEMASTDIVCRYQTEHNLKRTMVCNNKEFRIPVFVDCDAVTVRVLDLPPSVSNAAVSDYMIKFGEVISIRNETWKHYFAGLPNGVRVLRMNLFRDIPSTVSIQNQKTMVVYPNQPKPCGPSNPGEKTSDSSSTIETPSATSLSSSNLLNHVDFPPIDKQHHKSLPLAPTASSSVPIVEGGKHNEEDWTDIDDNDSNSSAEYSVVTHKRRRSTKQAKSDSKNVCNDQCSPNTGHVAERIIDMLSKEKVFSVKNKKGQFS